MFRDIALSESLTNVNDGYGTFLKHELCNFLFFLFLSVIHRSVEDVLVVFHIKNESGSSSRLSFWSEL